MQFENVDINANNTCNKVNMVDTDRASTELRSGKNLSTTITDNDDQVETFQSSSLQGYRFDPIYGTCNDINIENTNTNKNNSYNINNININNSDNQHNIDIFSNVKYKKKWMII